MRVYVRPTREVTTADAHRKLTWKSKPFTFQALITHRVVLWYFIDSTTKNHVAFSFCVVARLASALRRQTIHVLLVLKQRFVTFHFLCGCPPRLGPPGANKSCLSIPTGGGVYPSQAWWYSDADISFFELTYRRYDALPTSKHNPHALTTLLSKTL